MFNYERIGSKIKGLSKVSFIVGAIATAIIGISLLVIGGYENAAVLIIIGLLIIICGPIIAWVSSWLLYGFGELIDKVCDIELNTRTDKNIPTSQKKDTKATPKNSNKDTVKKENEERIISDDGIISRDINENTWVCPECCRENSNDITECKCGYKK